MNPAALRARIKRMTTLIEGVGKEAEAVRTNRGALTLQEWNRYLKALYNVKDGLLDARIALQEAVNRLSARKGG
jgi:hypothetical protein